MSVPSIEKLTALHPWTVVGVRAGDLLDCLASASDAVAAVQGELVEARRERDDAGLRWGEHYNGAMEALESRLEAVRGAMNHPDVFCLCGHESSLHAAKGKRPCTETADRASWHCPCNTFHPTSIPTRLLDAALLAAQPETDRRPINARFYPDVEEEPLVMVDLDDEPPASDEPARHGFHADGKAVDTKNCNRCYFEAMGPAASGTPGGER